MAEPAPSLLRRVIANGSFLAGLWFAGGAILDFARLEEMRLENLFGPALMLAAGGLFLMAAWRLRDAIRWTGNDNG